MLFSEEWLRHYINPDLTSEELTETLTMAGLEVEQMTTIAPPFTGVVVGKILTCVNHDNSDHLHVCTVDVGEASPLQIVCGAPNAKAGIKVPCAKIGAILPGGFTIKKAKMRGVESFGMLCSARELGVSEDHSGLWVLNEDAPIGQDIRKAERLDEKRIEIKLTPNRGDALSVIGVGRDLHAVTGAPLAKPDMTAVPATCSCVKPVHIKAPELCGRFTGRVIRGLNPKAPTPEWMKERLERSGQRSISALVDISNYIMLELGRPSHFYDLAKITGDLTVRWAQKGEPLELLNGQKPELDEYYGVVADEKGALGLAGIMGGESSAIGGTTTDLFIEAAFWFPEKIQGRCRRLNFSTDAAHRFERGVDFGSHIEHMEYATRLVLEICGTPETKIGPVDDQIVNLPKRSVVRMRPDRCRKVVGIEISDDFMAEAFTRLGFEFTRDGADFLVKSPTYRFDIEIEEDLIEEVARLYGYEKLPDREPVARATMLSHKEGVRTNHDLRYELVNRGYQELVNFSFIEEKWEKDFAGNDSPIRLLNPIASHLSVMRTQLVAGLVDILRYNLNRKAQNVRIFELGRVFYPDSSVEDGPWSVKGVCQPLHIAALAYGDAHDNAWGEAARDVDFFDVKGDLERLLFPLKATFVPERHTALHPGRSARVVVNGKPVGFIGELHPRLCQEYGLAKAPVVFEVDVADILVTPVPSPKAVTKFQPIERDFSLVVPNAVTAQQIFDAVAALKKEKAGAAIEDFKLFDLYKPKNETDVKSMAFHLTLVSHGDEALTEEAAERTQKRLLQVLSALGITLRA